MGHPISADNGLISHKLFVKAGHAINGNLKIILDSRSLNIVSKGPKYRFPSHIDFNRCREEIAFALNDFGNRLHRKYVLVPADKAANNVVIVCRLQYINTLKQELNGTKAKKRYLSTRSL